MVFPPLGPPPVINCEEYQADRVATCGHLLTIPPSSWTGVVVQGAQGTITYDYEFSPPMLFHPSGVFGWRPDLSEPACFDIGVGTITTDAGGAVSKPLCGCSGFAGNECDVFHGPGQFYFAWPSVVCEPHPNPADDVWRYEIRLSQLAENGQQTSAFPGCPTEAEPWQFRHFIPFGNANVIDEGSFSL